MNSKMKVSIAVGGIVLCLIVFAIMRVNSSDNNTSKSSDSKSKADSSIQNNASSVDILPGTSDRKSYNDLQNKENAKNAKAALADNSSFIPPLTQNNQDNKNDPFNDLNLKQTKPVEPKKEEKKVIDTTPPAAPTSVVQPSVPAAVPTQTATEYDYDGRSAQRDLVNSQLKGYMSQWVAKKSYQERDETGQKIASGDDASSASITNASATTSGSSEQSEQSQGAVLVRAGTIIPGVLITALNSDTPGPVLADIVSGKFKGARLIGTMNSSSEGIVIQFTKMSMKGQSKTFSINAYAVDPNTTGTYVASNVNNHYFQRYFLGLAAAFIDGYGEAVQNQNTTTSVGALGTVVQTQGQLNNAQISKSALGKVGQKLGQELDQDSSRNPTVTVNSGVPLGILFMSDL